MAKGVQMGIPNDIIWHSEHIVEARDWKFLHDFLKGKNKNLKILDVGCGNGNIMLSVIKNGFKNVQGVEYADFMFKKALTDYPFLRIRHGDAQNLRQYPNGSFDVVISCHVLEHLPNPEKAVKETSRVLKKGGYFVIGLPNGYHWNDILLRRVQMLFYRRYDHLQKFNLPKIIQLLNKDGFLIEKLQIAKGSIEILKDPRIKRFAFLTEKLLYTFTKKIYTSDMVFDILAIKK